MKSPTLLFVLLALVFPNLSRADCAVPQNYKERIEAFIKTKKPQIREFTFDYDQPTRVSVGDAKKEKCAVRCHWTPGRALMTVTSVFLFDGDSMSEVAPGTKIEWMDGEPPPERKKPNQSSEPTPPSVTDRAAARSAPAGGVAHL